MYCNGVFHHIPPAAVGAVAAVRAALRPGGFSLWENNPWNPGTRYVMSRIPFDRDASPLTTRAARRMLTAAGFSVIRTDFLFIFPRALRGLRPAEPLLSRLPLGTQYQVELPRRHSVKRARSVGRHQDAGEDDRRRDEHPPAQGAIRSGQNPDREKEQEGGPST